MGNVQRDVTDIEEVEDEKEGSDKRSHDGPSIVIGTPSELSKALHNKVVLAHPRFSTSKVEFSTNHSGVGR